MSKKLLSLLAAIVALAVAFAPGCGKSNQPEGVAFIELQYEAINLVPGGRKQIQVKSGKAEKVVVNKRSGLTAKVEGDTLTISAQRNAPFGRHAVTVRNDNGKQATVMVNVKQNRT